MLDIKKIRDNPALLKDALKKRGTTDNIDNLLQHDTQLREAQTKLQEIQTQRNKIAQSMAQVSDEAEKTLLKSSGEHLKTKAHQYEDQVRALEEQLKTLMLDYPNIPAHDVPEGQSEANNEELRTWGVPPLFAFEAKEHDQLSIAQSYMDFETATHVSGARFVFLKKDLAQLHRALKNFMLDFLTEESEYIEMHTPYLVNTEAMLGAGQLPKFQDDLFQTTDQKWLIPTAEVSLVTYVQDKILKEETLPLRLAAYTPCFRKEAGAAGKDTRGMIRQHQFEKVEMVSVTKPEQSLEEHDRMVQIEETILQRLNLPYRVMLLCTGDMGFHSQKTYDIEVWLPGQKRYREISSCSHCGDFQARRMNARFKSTTGDGKTQFVHTLNGSALPIGRTLIAILENYQDADGSVTIPDVLVPYMGYKTKLTCSI